MIPHLPPAQQLATKDKLLDKLFQRSFRISLSEGERCSFCVVGVGPQHLIASLAQIRGAGLFFGEESVEGGMLDFLSRVVAAVIGGQDGGVHRERGR